MHFMSVWSHLSEDTSLMWIITALSNFFYISRGSIIRPQRKRVERGTTLSPRQTLSTTSWGKAGARWYIVSSHRSMCTVSCSLMMDYMCADFFLPLIWNDFHVSFIFKSPVQLNTLNSIWTRRRIWKSSGLHFLTLKGISDSLCGLPCRFDKNIKGCVINNSCHAYFQQR